MHIQWTSPRSIFLHFPLHCCSWIFRTHIKYRIGTLFPDKRFKSHIYIMYSQTSHLRAFCFTHYHLQMQYSHSLQTLNCLELRSKMVPPSYLIVSKLANIYHLNFSSPINVAKPQSRMAPVPIVMVPVQTDLNNF